MSNPVLKSAILRVLDDPVVSQISFVMGGYEFRSSLYQLVRSAVNSDRIEVAANPHLGQTAYYDSRPGRNRIVLGQSCISTDTQRAHIVHEATHAGCDLRNHSSMSRDISEAAAHTAQCFFMCRKIGLERARQERLQGDSPPMDLVFEQAWRVAFGLMQNGFIHRSEVQRLRQLVMQVPRYSNLPMIAGYDGVP